MSIEITRMLMILFAWCTGNFVLITWLLTKIFRRMSNMENLYVMQLALSRRNENNLSTDISSLLSDIEKQIARAEHLKNKKDNNE